MLQRRLARVTLVTNEGLEDVLEIGRQARPDLYALDIDKPEPFAPGRRRIGVPERTTADGEVLDPIDDAELERLVERIAATRPEAIAVGLVYSFLHPRSERRIARALRRLGVPVCASSDVAPEVREFERFSTTVANAGLVPVVSRYLDSLARRLTGRRLFVFQSNGGMSSARDAAAAPVRLVLSGPAGGAVAAARIAERAGLDAAIALDMGGTSTDVSLVRGAPLRRGETSVGGHPLLVPTLDIETVGAGGGSIAWLDATHRLRVGPQSAGADPGPACYGRSNEPTVTDAHVALGRLPATLAGGEVELDIDRAHQAMERLGRDLGLSARAAALGVLRVADATMARAARTVVVGRGSDPRRMSLIAFGGAGPLHACRLIRVLPCLEAVVPPLPGNLSAYGMALADAERDLVRSVLIADPDRVRPRVDRVADELIRKGTRELSRDRLDRNGRIRSTVLLDCRYVGQTDTLPIAAGVRSIKQAFDGEHRDRYGHALEARTVEVVNVRVRLVVSSARRRVRRGGEVRRRKPPAAARSRVQVACFDGRTSVETPCYHRDGAPAGDPDRRSGDRRRADLDHGGRARLRPHRRCRREPTPRGETALTTPRRRSILTGLGVPPTPHAQGTPACSHGTGSPPSC